MGSFRLVDFNHQRRFQSGFINSRQIKSLQFVIGSRTRLSFGRVQQFDGGCYRVAIVNFFVGKVQQVVYLHVFKLTEVIAIRNVGARRFIIQDSDRTGVFADAKQFEKFQDMTSFLGKKLFMCCFLSSGKRLDFGPEIVWNFRVEISRLVFFAFLCPIQTGID